jgi:hypothetical protein
MIIIDAYVYVFNETATSLKWTSLLRTHFKVCIMTTRIFDAFSVLYLEIGAHNIGGFVVQFLAFLLNHITDKMKM